MRVPTYIEQLIQHEYENKIKSVPINIKYSEVIKKAYASSLAKVLRTCTREELIQYTMYELTKED